MRVLLALALLAAAGAAALSPPWVLALLIPGLLVVGSSRQQAEPFRGSSVEEIVGWLE